MHKIPQEVKDLVLKYLLPKDLKSMRLVNRSFNKHAAAFLFSEIVINRNSNNHPFDVLNCPSTRQHIQKVTLHLPKKYSEGVFTAPEELPKAKQLSVEWEYSTPTFELISPPPHSVWDTDTTLLMLAKMDLVRFQKVIVRLMLDCSYKELPKSLDKYRPFFHKVTELQLVFEIEDFVEWRDDPQRMSRFQDILAADQGFAVNVESLTLKLETDAFFGYPLSSIDARNFLSTGKSWPRLRDLHLSNIRTTGRGLGRFLRAHARKLEKIELDSVNFVWPERIEAESPITGLLEVIQTMANSVQLKECGFSGRLVEQHDKGIAWLANDYRRNNQEKTHSRGFQQASNTEKCLSRVVRDYVLRGGEWPFPDRAWFTNAVPDWIAWTAGSKSPRAWEFGDNHGRQEVIPFGDPSWKGYPWMMIK